MRKYKGEVGLALTAVIWGFGFVCTDEALKYMTPYQTNLLRFFIASIILLIIYRSRLKLINKKILYKGFILGIFLFLGFTFQTIGLSHTTPSKNAFLTGLNVIAVPFIAYMFDRAEKNGMQNVKLRIQKNSIIAAFVSIAGIGVLSFNLDFSINIGDLLSIICAFMFAFHIYFTGRFVLDCDAPLLTVVQLTFTCLLSLIVVIFKGQIVSIMLIPPKGFLPVLYLGVFSTCIAYILQTVCQKYAEPVKAAVILSLESVFGAFFSLALGIEPVTQRIIIGSTIIFSAVLISELGVRTE